MTVECTSTWQRLSWCYDADESNGYCHTLCSHYCSTRLSHFHEDNGYRGMHQNNL